MATLDDIEGPADMEPKHSSLTPQWASARPMPSAPLRQAIQWFKGVDAIG